MDVLWISDGCLMKMKLARWNVLSISKEVLDLSYLLAANFICKSLILFSAVAFKASIQEYPTPSEKKIKKWVATVRFALARVRAKHTA